MKNITTSAVILLAMTIYVLGFISIIVTIVLSNKKNKNKLEKELNRLETLVLMSGIDIPIKAVREYIENAINIVVNIQRMHDGKRKITSICEVDGFDKDMIKLIPIFEFIQMGLTDTGEERGEFTCKNKKPNVAKLLKSRGIKLDMLK